PSRVQVWLWIRFDIARCAPFLFVGERFHARKLLAFQKLQRSSTAGRDMSDLVCQTRLMDSGNRIASADNGCTSPIPGNRFSDLHGAMGKWRNFKNAHWTVPYNRLRTRNFFTECGDCFRTNVQPHLVGWDALICRYGLGLNASINLFGNYMVERQQQPDVLCLGVLQE